MSQVEEEEMKISRIDIIGQNGPTGEHYDKVKRLSCWSCNNYAVEHDGGVLNPVCREGHNELVPNAGSFDCESFTLGSEQEANDCHDRGS